MENFLLAGEYFLGLGTFGEESTPKRSERLGMQRS